MGAFKNAATPPYDLRLLAEAVVGRFGTFPTRWDVWRAVDEWGITTPEEMSQQTYEAFVSAIHAVARLISADPKA